MIRQPFTAKVGGRRRVSQSGFTAEPGLLADAAAAAVGCGVVVLCVKYSSMLLVDPTAGRNAK